MRALQIVQNTIGYVNAPVAITNQGWTISDGYALHDSCNPGNIIGIGSFGLTVGRDYTVSYTVDEYVSGSVRVLLGGNAGLTRTAPGTYTETLSDTSNPTISFFSDGTLRVGSVSFYDTLLGPQAAQVISFNDKASHWTSDYEYENDTMAKFIDSFISWKGGELWVHNTNPVQNNLYGTQYSSKITLVVNSEFQREKIFYNFRLDAVGNWYMPSITTPQSNQFPGGMSSYLKKNNFKLIDNKLWAEILGDVNDPNLSGIANAAQKLFTARKMQGGWLIVNLQVDDATYSEISSIETYYSEVYRNV